MLRNTDIHRVHDLRDHGAELRRDRFFFIGPETGHVLTFKELQEQARHSIDRRAGAVYV